MSERNAKLLRKLKVNDRKQTHAWNTLPAHQKSRVRATYWANTDREAGAREAFVEFARILVLK